MENETSDFNQEVSDIPQVTYSNPSSPSGSSGPSGPSNFFSNISKKFERANKGSLVLVVGGLLFGILIGALFFSGGITGAAVSTGDIKSTFSELFPQATVTDVQDQDSFWNISLLSETASGLQEGGVLMTKDGKYLVIGPVINLDDVRAELANQSEDNTVTATTEIPKSDKPKVELFVMSYCPFGLQMEKALLPARALLKDVADFEIKFVHYIMHGEKEAVENLRQYCIQKSDKEKFWSYLECFVGSDGADGASDKCMVTAKVDKASTDKCIADARKEFKVDEDLASGEQFPRFRVDETASKAYGVEGSPTLIINGVVSSAQRSPDAVKKAVCSALNKESETCGMTLSTAASSAGFGVAAGSDTGASCG